MQKYRVIILLLIILSSCVPQSGNYAKLSNSYNTQIATDITRQLLAFYPPASTHFVLSKSTEDAFGITLEKKLRENGYGIETADSGVKDWFSKAFSTSTTTNKTESHSDRIVSDNTSHAAAIKATKNDFPASASTKNTALSYTIDAIGDNFYSVTVKSDIQVMSRVYSIAGSHLSAAGAWTRKE